jgi:hypothetical protein
MEPLWDPALDNEEPEPYLVDNKTAKWHPAHPLAPPCLKELCFLDEETSVGGGKAASGYLTACPAWPAQGLIPVSPTPTAKKTKTKSKSKTPGLYYGRQQRLTLKETPPWYSLLAPQLAYQRKTPPSKDCLALLSTKRPPTIK